MMLAAILLLSAACAADGGDGRQTAAVVAVLLPALLQLSGCSGKYSSDSSGASATPKTCEMQLGPSCTLVSTIHSDVGLPAI